MKVKIFLNNLVYLLHIFITSIPTLLSMLQTSDSTGNIESISFLFVYMRFIIHFNKHGMLEGSILSTIAYTKSQMKNRFFNNLKFYFRLLVIPLPLPFPYSNRNESHSPCRNSRRLTTSTTWLSTVW